MSSDEAAFLNAIRTNPADETARLVYADWLADRDDPRADFARLSAEFLRCVRGLAALRQTAPAEWVRDVDPLFERFFFVTVPSLGEGVEVGTVTVVHIAPGDVIEAGQVIVTLETDKATIELPAERAGCVLGVIVAPGETVRVGTILCACVVRAPSGQVPVALRPLPQPQVPRQPFLDFIERLERRRATYEASPPEFLGALIARHTTAAVMLFGVGAVQTAEQNARYELGLPASSRLVGADALNVHLSALRLLLERHGQPVQFAPGAGESP